MSNQLTSQLTWPAKKCCLLVPVAQLYSFTVKTRGKKKKKQTKNKTKVGGIVESVSSIS
jgi:hypothetical protein